MCEPLDKSLFYLYICEFLPQIIKLKKNSYMENLIELLKQQQEGYDDIKAEKKLSLFYHKAHSAGIESFLDEFFEWLLLTKQMDYKAIMRMSDHDLHDMYELEYKK